MTKTERVSSLKAETIEALTPTLTPDQHQVVFGSGDPTSPLMLVGEAPGPQEDARGEPFVGKSGQLLQQVLGEVGITRSQIWISNVVKVWPTTRDGKSLKTRPPTAAEKKPAAPFLIANWKLFNRRSFSVWGAQRRRHSWAKSLRSPLRGANFATDRWGFKPSPRSTPPTFYACKAWHRWTTNRRSPTSAPMSVKRWKKPGCSGKHEGDETGFLPLKTRFLSCSPQ